MAYVSLSIKFETPTITSINKFNVEHGCYFINLNADVLNISEMITICRNDFIACILIDENLTIMINPFEQLICKDGQVIQNPKIMRPSERFKYVGHTQNITFFATLHYESEQFTQQNDNSQNVLRDITTNDKLIFLKKLPDNLTFQYKQNIEIACSFIGTDEPIDIQWDLNEFKLSSNKYVQIENYLEG